MTTVLLPDTSDNPDDEIVLNPESKDDNFIPKWAWGVFAGGGALLITGIGFTYHFVSKKIRQERQIEHVKKEENLYWGETIDMLSPRNDNPPPKKKETII